MNTNNEDSCYEATLRELRRDADLLTTVPLEGCGNFRIQVPERVF